MDIGVVIVTYNRIEKLKVALDLFDRQTLLPKYLIVVDNASTDGTAEYLLDWKRKEIGYKKIVITSEINSGGSGGFYLGLEESLKQETDWVWVSDDDAYPELDVLEKAQRHLDNINGGVSAICGMVLNNGIVDISHRSRRPIKGIRVGAKSVDTVEYQKEYFEINDFTYVGSIINKKSMEKAGLPIKDYFIWRDDEEHSLRLSKIGKILCFPDIVINHNVLNDNSGRLTWKDYYGYRNLLDLLRRHYGKLVAFIYYSYFKFGARMKILFRKNVRGNKMILDALKDYKNRKFGISEIYKPGTKI